jgi:hypothetical protein
MSESRILGCGRCEVIKKRSLGQEVHGIDLKLAKVRLLYRLNLVTLSGVGE